MICLIANRYWQLLTFSILCLFGWIIYRTHIAIDWVILFPFSALGWMSNAICNLSACTSWLWTDLNCVVSAEPGFKPYNHNLKQKGMDLWGWHVMDISRYGLTCLWVETSCFQIYQLLVSISNILMQLILMDWLFSVAQSSILHVRYY